MLLPLLAPLAAAEAREAWRFSTARRRKRRRRFRSAFNLGRCALTSPASAVSTFGSTVASLPGWSLLLFNTSWHTNSAASNTALCSSAYRTFSLNTPPAVAPPPPLPLLASTPPAPGPLFSARCCTATCCHSTPRNQPAPPSNAASSSAVKASSFSVSSASCLSLSATNEAVWRLPKLAVVPHTLVASFTQPCKWSSRESSRSPTPCSHRRTLSKAARCSSTSSLSLSRNLPPARPPPAATPS
mmetsp:Transcript_71290/g.134315  ORF Transcript_71290/g.134315 Transcript_71290/m.134315 type:complete len:243 (+) Transcript_71290:500-1228(+)